MKSHEFIIDLKNSQNVFEAFNSVFSDELATYTWRIKSWDGLDDFLWGFIQGPFPEEPAPYGRDIEKYDIKIINSGHLANIPDNSHAQSIQQGLRDSFESMVRQRDKKVGPADLPVFKNSTLEIIS